MIDRFFCVCGELQFVCAVSIDNCTRSSSFIAIIQWFARIGLVYVGLLNFVMSCPVIEDGEFYRLFSLLSPSCMVLHQFCGSLLDIRRDIVVRQKSVNRAMRLR